MRRCLFIIADRTLKIVIVFCIEFFEQFGNTALISTASQGRSECARLLVASGASMDTKNKVRICAYVRVLSLYLSSNLTAMSVQSYDYCIGSLMFWFPYVLMCLFSSFFFSFYLFCVLFSSIYLCLRAVAGRFVAICGVGTAANFTKPQFGVTALICAAEWGQTDCVRALVEGGANMEVKNNVRGRQHACDQTFCSCVCECRPFSLPQTCFFCPSFDNDRSKALH